MSWELTQKLYDEYLKLDDKYQEFTSKYICYSCEKIDSQLVRCYDCKKLVCSNCRFPCGNEYCKSKLCNQCYDSTRNDIIRSRSFAYNKSIFDVKCKACGYYDD